VPRALVGCTVVRAEPPSANHSRRLGPPFAHQAVASSDVDERTPVGYAASTAIQHPSQVARPGRNGAAWREHALINTLHDSLLHRQVLSRHRVMRRRCFHDASPSPRSVVPVVTSQSGSGRTVRRCAFSPEHAPNTSICTFDPAICMHSCVPTRYTALARQHIARRASARSLLEPSITTPRGLRHGLGSLFASPAIYTLYSIQGT
jgi:hypothetical protein